MGNELQNNEQTITTASALPTAGAKSNNRVLTVENVSLGDSSSCEEDLETAEKASHNAIDGQIWTLHLSSGSARLVILLLNYDEGVQPTVFGHALGVHYPSVYPWACSRCPLLLT